MRIFVNMPDGFRENSFITEEVKQKLKSVGDVTFSPYDKQLGGEELAEVLKDYDCIITGWGQPKITTENIGNVKLIAHTGGTIGGIVDMGIFDTDVTVLSGNNYYAQSVAEGVISYMLFALRKMSYYESKLRQGVWDWNIKSEGLLGQSVGIISYGAISSRVIPMLRCFTDNIKVYSTRQNPELAKREGFTYASLDEIFSTCKVVSVHTAKNDDTYHMINKHHFDLLQDGALFINTSRGPVIDEDALVESLKENRFRALLDVYNQEPLSPDHPLLKLDNAILFPHMAGPTYDRRAKITMALIDDIADYFNGKEPDDVVTKEIAQKMTIA